MQPTLPSGKLAHDRPSKTVKLACFLIVLCLGHAIRVSSEPEAEAGANLLAGAPKTEDGRFANPVGPLEHGSLGVRLPFGLRRLGTFFREGRNAPERVANDGAFLRKNARGHEPGAVQGPSEATVTWVGHATLLVQLGGVTFLTDPIWSEHPSPIASFGPSRYVPPGIAIEDLPPIDFVVISHNHYDHLDLPSLRAVAAHSPRAQFLVPLGNEDLLAENGIEKIQSLDWGESRSLSGSTIRCLPAQHWSKRSLRDDNRALWSSWAIEAESKRFYFSGDTGYFDGFRQIGEAYGPFDLAAIAIGAYAPRAMMAASHMNPEEALQAAIDLGAKRALGIHFGTFDLSDEPLDEPPRRFRAAAKSAGRPDESTWILRIGETRRF